MKRFVFPLSRLHRWRAQQELLARRALGAALGQLARLERRLADVAAGLRACEAEAATPAAPLAAALAGGLARQQRQLESERADAEVAAAAARAAYVARRRERRALDRLHDKRHATWLADCARIEQQETDDLVRMRAHRPRQEAAPG